jgi:hypothetical protein
VLHARVGVAGSVGEGGGGRRGGVGSTQGLTAAFSSTIEVEWSQEGPGWQCLRGLRDTDRHFMFILI